MKKISTLISLASCLFFSTTAHAQFNPASRIQNEQQQLINEEFRRQELQRALKRPDVEKETPTVKPVKEPTTPSACIKIKEVKFTGNNALKDKKIDDVVAKYKNKCVSLADIDAMLQDITNVYIEKGHVTSRAFMKMPQKKLKEGILEIQIVEGKISAIEGLTKPQLFTAFPSLINKILNIRDIEQGLDQINRLPSNQATMEIKPDKEKNDFSKILINNKSKGRNFFTLFGDNAGSKSTGETRFGFRQAMDNLFGVNDQINMTYTNSPSQSSDHRAANSFALGTSIPYGYWTLNNNFSWSNYRTSFILVNGDRFFSYGNSTTNDISLDRILSRGQKHKISASGGFIYKANDNYTRVLDLKVHNKVSSRDLAILHFDLPSTFYTDYGIFYAKPSYYQGIRAFGAMSDDDFNYSQKAQYKAWKLYGYYNNYFGIVNWTTTLDSQYTKDELFGSEAFLIGGEYTVRGFKEDSVQGDKGFTIRNDAKINMATLLKTENQMAQAITPGVFVDYGYVASNNKYLKDEQLTGAGAKVEVNYKFFEGSLSYAKPIHKPDYLDENHVWYLYAGVGFRF